MIPASDAHSKNHGTNVCRLPTSAEFILVGNGAGVPGKAIFKTSISVTNLVQATATWSAIKERQYRAILPLLVSMEGREHGNPRGC
jgi:hypothetical protein